MKYSPRRQGFKEVGQSAKVQAATLAAAYEIAAWANTDDPWGAYQVERATVPTGWDNEPRAGARVVATRRGRGPDRRTLVRAVRAIG